MKQAAPGNKKCSDAAIQQDFLLVLGIMYVQGVPNHWPIIGPSWATNQPLILVQPVF